MTADCSVDECVRPVKTRSWCGTHYERWRTTGTTDTRTTVAAECSAEDCLSSVFSNGWCQKHHSRMRRLGRLHLDAPLTLTERLVSGVTVQADGCWVWTATAPRANGYAAISVGNQLEYVHRLSYETFCGPITTGLTIDHLCRVRLCARPDHLEPVTRAENTRRELAVRWSA